MREATIHTPVESGSGNNCCHIPLHIIEGSEPE